MGGDVGFRSLAEIFAGGSGTAMRVGTAMRGVACGGNATCKSCFTLPVSPVFGSVDCEKGVRIAWDASHVRAHLEGLRGESQRVGVCSSEGVTVVRMAVDETPLQILLKDLELGDVPSLDRAFSHEEKGVVLEDVVLRLDELSVFTQFSLGIDPAAYASAAIQFGMKRWDQTVLHVLGGHEPFTRIVAWIISLDGGGRLRDLSDLIPDSIKDIVLDIVVAELKLVALGDFSRISVLIHVAIDFGRKEWDDALLVILSIGFPDVVESFIGALEGPLLLL